MLCETVTVIHAKCKAAIAERRYNARSMEVDVINTKTNVIGSDFVDFRT
jgi:hypothetical protein